MVQVPGLRGFESDPRKDRDFKSERVPRVRTEFFSEPHRSSTRPQREGVRLKRRREDVQAAFDQENAITLLDQERRDRLIEETAKNIRHLGAEKERIERELGHWTLNIRLFKNFTLRSQLADITERLEANSRVLRHHLQEEARERYRSTQ